MVACVSDSFYKIISEALSVLKKIVEIIRPLGEWMCSADVIGILTTDALCNAHEAKVNQIVNWMCSDPVHTDF